MISKLLISVLSIILFSFFPSYANAQDSKGSITVMPAFSEVILKKGESKKITVKITNNDTKEITLDLFPLDFRQQGEQGDIAFLGRDESSYSYSLASFLSLESQHVTIQPKSSQDITVTAADREDLSPGGHYAALIGRLVQDENPTQTVLAPSISSLILLKKTGGERYNISLLSSNWPDSLAFRYPGSSQVLFQNEGNVHLVPYGTFEVKDIFGRVLFQGVLNSASHIVFPETRRYITADVTRVQKSLPVSLNLVTIKGEDSLKKVTFVQRNTFIYIHPGVFVVLIGIAFLIARLARIKRKRNTK